MKYRKKPVVIEAMQFQGGHVSALECADFIGPGSDINISDATLYIHTLAGTMTASPGDYIIRGVRGEYYPCEPKIFWETYEVVDD